MGQANSTRDGRRCISVAGMFVCLLLALAACAPSSVSAGNGSSRTPVPYTGAVCSTTACAAHGVQVFVEPDAGEAPVLRAIKGATTSVWVEVCTPGNG